MNAKNRRLFAGRIAVVACAFFAITACTSCRTKAPAQGRAFAETNELKRRVDALWVDRDFTENERQVLADLCTTLQSVHQAIKEQREVGTVDMGKPALAAHHLYLAEARLALASAKYEDVSQAYEKAIKEAETYLAVSERMFEVGESTLEFHIAAHRSVAEIKIEASRAARRVAHLSTPTKAATLQGEGAETRRRVEYMWIDWDYTDAERQALRDLCTGLQSIHQTMGLVANAGAANDERVALAARSLHRAEARLAWASAQYEDVSKAFDATVNAAKQALTELQAQFEAGHQLFDFVLEAQIAVAEIKFEANRAARRVALVSQPLPEVSTVQPDGSEAAEMERRIDHLWVEWNFIVTERQALADISAAWQNRMRREEARRKGGLSYGSQLALAEQHLHQTQARLAWASAKYEDIPKAYDKALKAAQRYATVTANSFAAGAASPLEFVLAAHVNLAELKLEASRAKRRIAILANQDSGDGGSVRKRR